jgi:two-component system NarL family response regulator
MVLESEDGIEVVGEADDGVEAAALAEQSAPDVVLMDVRMPGMSGIDATRRIAEVVPTAKIIMLTVSDEEEDLYEAIKAGAAGYLLKEISIEEVGHAVRSVSSGQSLISPSMAGKLLTEFTTLARQADTRPSVPTPTLTDRELEVLRLVAEGLSNKAVGQKLFISENTVKNHVRNILEKLHLHSRMEAVMYAVREKLLDIE